MGPQPISASPPPASGFVYEPLSTPKSLRFIKVLPSLKEGCIQVDIWESLETIPYRCLCYVWGYQTEKYPLLLNDQTMLVGKNLHEFLAVATQRFPGQAVWIDALCINQNNYTKKSAQVQQKGKVYKEATRVLGWLGKDDGITKLFDWTQSRQRFTAEPGVTFHSIQRPRVY
jgi:hypothetical protein